MLIFRLQPKDEPHTTLRKQNTTLKSIECSSMQRNHHHKSSQDIGMHIDASHLNRSYISDTMDGREFIMEGDSERPQLVTDGAGRVYTLSRSTNGSIGGQSNGARHADRHRQYDTVSLTLSNLRLAEANGEDVHRSAPQGLSTTSRPHTSASSYPERYRKRRSHPSAVHGSRGSAVVGEAGDGEAGVAIATAFHDPSATTLQHPQLFTTSADNVFLGPSVSPRDFESISRSSYAIHN